MKTISLEELNQLALMERVDSKFTVDVNLIPKVLEALIKDYAVLTINGKQRMKYLSKYFDTNNFELYRLHHNGKFNRFKVRIREYCDTGAFFFETKFKNNRGKTFKTRYQKQNKFEYTQTAKAFIREHTTLNADDLKIGLEVLYTRTTFANLKTGERVTLDTDLIYTLDGKTKEYHNFAIIEVKTGKGSKNSPILKILQELRIGPFGMSKYCLGIVNLSNNVKKNIFKEKVLHLEKIGKKR